MRGRIVIPGGSGHLGRRLAAHYSELGHEVVVLSRGAAGVPGARVVQWDGATAGPWTDEIDGAAAVINLAGRTVGCRYTKKNLTQMYASRIDSARVVARAIADAAQPPAVLLQMSTATIYSHRFDAANDEVTGVIGGHEPDVPEYWRFSVEIAQRWEQEALAAPTRVVLLRTAMVMDDSSGGTFDKLLQMVRLRVGGSVAGGEQYISWIHADDFVRALDFLLDSDLDGPVNLAAPEPLPNKDFMATLRRTAGVGVGIPATRWQTVLGGQVVGVDAELLLKSRRVVPTRLLEAGFTFEHPGWATAAADLVG